MSIVTSAESPEYCRMLDVQFTTIDSRTLILSRYTELNAEQELLVHRLNLDWPPQPRSATAAALCRRHHREV